MLGKPKLRLAMKHPAMCPYSFAQPVRCNPDRLGIKTHAVAPLMISATFQQHATEILPIGVLPHDEKFARWLPTSGATRRPAGELSIAGILTAASASARP
jgi:hypothetical protein